MLIANDVFEMRRHFMRRDAFDCRAYNVTAWVNEKTYDVYFGSSLVLSFHYQSKTVVHFSPVSIDPVITAALRASFYCN